MGSDPREGGDVVTPMDVYVRGQAVQLPKWQGWAKAPRRKLAQMTEDMHFPLPAAVGNRLVGTGEGVRS